MCFAVTGCQAQPFTPHAMGRLRDSLECHSSSTGMSAWLCGAMPYGSAQVSRSAPRALLEVVRRTAKVGVVDYNEYGQQPAITPLQ